MSENFDICYAGTTTLGNNTYEIGF